MPADEGVCEMGSRAGWVCPCHSRVRVWLQEVPRLCWLHQGPSTGPAPGSRATIKTRNGSTASVSGGSHSHSHESLLFTTQPRSQTAGFRGGPPPAPAAPAPRLPLEAAAVPLKCQLQWPRLSLFLAFQSQYHSKPRAHGRNYSYYSVKGGLHELGCSREGCVPPWE